MKILRELQKKEEFTPPQELSFDDFMGEITPFLEGLSSDAPLMLAYADVDASRDCIRADFGEFPADYQVVSLPDGYGSVIVFSLAEKSKHELLASLEEISVKNSFRLTVSAPSAVNSDLFAVLKGIIKDSDYRVLTCNDSVIDSETIKRFDGNIPDEFFSCFFAFYNGIKVGDRQLVIYNLEEIRKCVVNMYAPDVFRLTYMNMVHCFSKHLSEEYTEPHIMEFPGDINEAFDIISNLTDKYFEKMLISGNNSEYLKREVLRIVENEISSPVLSVTMLADRLGISTSYLSRYFKEKTGVTLFSYIDDIRIAKAKKLLAETEMPVKDIVHAVGYNDVNNFNRKFKSKTGQTPSSFRK